MEHNNMMHDHKEGMPMEAGMSMARRCWHWACCILPGACLLMWVAAVVFLVLSWVSVLNTTGELWNLGPQWYIWNTVMFGILAIYGSKKRSCGSGCNCKNGTC